jgi:threonine/homoserine/homoserine lactone efflux protein
MTLPVHDLALFVVAALFVNVTPGPDMLFVAGTSASQGRRCGLLAALGVGLGCFVHIALAALGLSAILATSALAFAVLTWAGAAYLIGIGVSMLRRQRASAGPVLAAAAGVSGPFATVPRSAAKAFWRGAMTNALNPKVALFFLAFLPQFIEPGSPDQARAFVLLGLFFTVGGVLVNATVALVAGALAQRLAGGALRGRWLQRVAGVVFVGLGLRLALSAR